MLVSLRVMEMPLTWEESIEVDASIKQYGIWVVTSDEKFTDQLEFFDLFSFLFFAFTSLEILLLIILFFLLSYFLKVLLISLAKSNIVRLN